MRLVSRVLSLGRGRDLLLDREVPQEGMDMVRFQRGWFAPPVEDSIAPDPPELVLLRGVGVVLGTQRILQPLHQHLPVAPARTDCGGRLWDVGRWASGVRR